MSVINFSNKYKIGVVFIAFTSIIVGFYLAIFKSFDYQSNNQTIGNVMILISLFTLLMLWIDYSGNSRWKKFIFYTFMTILAIFIILSTFLFRDIYLDSELKQNGVETTGKVTGFEIESHRRSRTDYATFTYEFKNRTYIQRIENYKNEYKINQTLNLRISKKNPEMFEVLE